MKYILIIDIIIHNIHPYCTFNDLTHVKLTYILSKEMTNSLSAGGWFKIFVDELFIFLLTSVYLFNLFTWFRIIYYTCKRLYHVSGRQYRLHVYHPSLLLNQSVLFFMHTLFKHKNDELILDKMTVILYLERSILKSKS